MAGGQHRGGAPPGAPLTPHALAHSLTAICVEKLSSTATCVPEYKVPIACMNKIISASYVRFVMKFRGMTVLLYDEFSTRSDVLISVGYVGYTRLLMRTVPSSEGRV